MSGGLLGAAIVGGMGSSLNEIGNQEIKERNQSAADAREAARQEAMVRLRGQLDLENREYTARENRKLAEDQRDWAKGSAKPDYSHIQKMTRRSVDPETGAETTEDYLVDKRTGEEIRPQSAPAKGDSKGGKRYRNPKTGEEISEEEFNARKAQATGGATNSAITDAGKKEGGGLLDGVDLGGIMESVKNGSTDSGRAVVDFLKGLLPSDEEPASPDAEAKDKVSWDERIRSDRRDFDQRSENERMAEEHWAVLKAEGDVEKAKRWLAEHGRKLGRSDLGDAIKWLKDHGVNIEITDLDNPLAGIQ